MGVCENCGFEQPKPTESYGDLMLRLLTHANDQPRAYSIDADRIWREEISQWQG